MQSSPRPPLDPNLLRVLVVGETKVGKTLLIRRLCHQVFSFAAAAAASTSKESLSTPKHEAEEAADVIEEDFYFAAKWAPTIGFDVDCLVRDAYGVRDAHGSSNSHTNRYVSPSGQAGEDGGTPFAPKTPTASTGGGHLTRRNSSLNSPGVLSAPRRSYRSGDSGAASPTVPSSATSRMYLAPLDYFASGDPASGADSSFLIPQQSIGHHHRSVVQTVELYELGGTHMFSPDCALPLPLMDFDGIMFLYNRADTESTTRLSEWYGHMKRLFTPADTETEGRRPRVMLVGTQLTASSSLSRMLGSVDGRGTSNGGCDLGAGDYFPPDDALVDPDMRRLHVQQRRGSRRGKGYKGQPGFIARKLGGCLLSLLTFARLICHPSLILSEQYQEERSTRSFRLFFHLLESLAALLMWVERFILYLMATVLFGFYQSVVTVRQPTVRASLDTIREDRFFSAQCHVCRLYDRSAFESSVDEIVNFFDILHREKLCPTLH